MNALWLPAYFVETAQDYMHDCGVELYDGYQFLAQDETKNVIVHCNV